MAAVETEQVAVSVIGEQNYDAQVPLERNNLPYLEQGVQGSDKQVSKALTGQSLAEAPQQESMATTVSDDVRKLIGTTDIAGSWCNMSCQSCIFAWSACDRVEEQQEEKQVGVVTVRTKLHGLRKKTFCISLYGIPVYIDGCCARRPEILYTRKPDTNEFEEYSIRMYRVTIHSHVQYLSPSCAFTWCPNQKEAIFLQIGIKCPCSLSRTKDETFRPVC